MKKLIAIVILLFIYIPAKADFKFEFQGMSNYYSNVFQNAQDKDDNQTSAKLTVNYFPTSFLKFDASSNIGYYGITDGLRNMNANIGVTCFPLKEDSKFSLYLNLSFAPTYYFKDSIDEKMTVNEVEIDTTMENSFKKFENNVVNGNVALGYQLSDKVKLRTGFEFTATNYKKENDSLRVNGQWVFDISGDQTKYFFFVGGNIVGPCGNVLDFDIGYGNLSVEYVNHPTDSEFIGYWVTRDYLQVTSDTLHDGNIKAFNISPRISRSLGSKWGATLTYNYRKFNDEEGKVIPGASTSFLSPYSSVYEGSTVTFSVKTFIIPNFVVSTGYGYWDKTFLTSEKLRNVNGRPPYVIHTREDYMAKFYFSTKRMFTFKSGLSIEPVLMFDYSDNKSSDNTYDYSAVTISGGVNIKF